MIWTMRFGENVNSNHIVRDFLGHINLKTIKGKKHLRLFVNEFRKDIDDHGQTMEARREDEDVINE